MVKKLIFTIVALFLMNSASAQVINKDKLKLSNFVERLYKNSPFSGVKLIDDEDTKYLLSVVILNPDKYKGNEAVMNKVASVKATSQASTYFNGSSINAETVIHTTENADGSTDVDMIEKIRENSVGYVKSIELLTSFPDEKGQMVYVYSKSIEMSTSEK